MPDHLAPTTAAGGTVWPTDPGQVPDQSPGQLPDQEPEPLVETAEDDQDADRWAAWDAPRPFNRLSAVLGVALVAVLAFGGGVLLQQKTGTASTPAAAARPGGFTGYGRGLGQGYGGQGFSGQGFSGQGVPGQVPGAGGLPGGNAGDAAGSPAGNSSGTTGAGSGGAGSGGAGSGGAGSGEAGSAAATSPPVAVGTVATLTPSGAGGTLTVRTFGGTTVVVAVPPTATVTLTGLNTRLAVGGRVVVHGTRGADGKVTATSLTVR